MKGYDNMTFLKSGGEGNIYLTLDNKIVKVIPFSGCSIDKCICHYNTRRTEHLTEDTIIASTAIAKQLSDKIPKYVPLVYDIIRDKCIHGVSYIALVMEYINGIICKDFIQNIRKGINSTYTLRRACNIITNYITAVTAIQSCGYVHRDLSAWNVLILPDDTVKIIDFGQSQILTSYNLDRDIYMGVIVILMLASPEHYSKFIDGYTHDHITYILDSKIHPNKSTKLLKFIKFIRSQWQCSYSNLLWINPFLNS